MRFNRIFLLLLLSCLLFCSCEKASAIASDEKTDIIDTLTFLGDSTTAHMLTRAPIKDKKQVWVAKNRYLNLDPRITYAKITQGEEGDELTIAEMARKIKPTRLVITLGVDYGVYYYRNDQATFAFYYEKLLNAIGEASPDTVLILQSIFPVAKSSTAITNQMIGNANQTIKSIAAKRGLIYIDANTPLSDEDGFLRAEYCSSADGIHLTSAAYRVIFDTLRQSAAQIKEATA